jgi:hypothetical protein
MSKKLKLKNRATLFLTIRQDSRTHSEIPIAAFTTMERAEEYAGVCLQEFLDKGITEYVFGVVPVIYYDE